MAAAFAPSAQAAELKADFFTVQAVATMAPSQLVATSDGQVTLAVECAAADPTSKYAPAYIYKCSVGPLSASTYCGFECFGMPFESAVGRAPFSAAYELCVGAGSFGTGTTNFHRCVPLDPATGTAVITG
jgi:hypothetical protein